MLFLLLQAGVLAQASATATQKLCYEHTNTYTQCKSCTTWLLQIRTQISILTTTSHYLHRLFVPMGAPIELRSNSFLCLGCIAHFHSLILQVCDTCSAPSPPVSCLALGQTFHVPAPQEDLYLDVLLCKKKNHQHKCWAGIRICTKIPLVIKKFFQILKFDSYHWS